MLLSINLDPSFCVQFVKMVSNRKRKRTDKRQTAELSNDMTENNGDVPQNEIINETETEVTNNEDANMDDVEDKSKTDGDVPQIEIVNETESEVTNNEDANMDDVEDESKTEPTVGGDVNATTAQPIACDDIENAIADDKSRIETEVDGDADATTARPPADDNCNGETVLELDVGVDGRCDTHEIAAVGVDFGATVTETEAGVNTPDGTALPVNETTLDIDNNTSAHRALKHRRKTKVLVTLQLLLSNLPMRPHLIRFWRGKSTGTQ
jgi:hypothetical protein